VREVAEALVELLKGGGRGALATVVRTAGSTPQEAGARPQLLARDLGYDLGMCCGGRMEIFIEPVEAAPRLWLFGAGHVARPTAALARSVGFDVTVVDEREELNNEARFPACRREVCEPLALLDATPLDAGDWLLITTHDHHLDEEVLARALRTPARFIGLVGSRRKTLRLLQRIDAKQEALAAPAQELGGAAAPPLDRSRLFAPVGLDIGALGPEEIAVSVVAELVALRRGRAAAHLRAVEDVRLLRRIGGA